MRFCPKCGGLMVPAKRGKESYLRCTKCGYEVKASGLSEYRVSENVSSEERIVTTSKVSEGAGRRLRSREEHLQELEEYYEVALELLQEEFGEGE